MFILTSHFIPLTFPTHPYTTLFSVFTSFWCNFRFSSLSLLLSTCNSTTYTWTSVSLFFSDYLSNTFLLAWTL